MHNFKNTQNQGRTVCFNFLTKLNGLMNTNSHCTISCRYICYWGSL